MVKRICDLCGASGAVGANLHARLERVRIQARGKTVAVTIQPVSDLDENSLDLCNLCASLAIRAAAAKVAASSLSGISELIDTGCLLKTKCIRQSGSACTECESPSVAIIPDCRCPEEASGRGAHYCAGVRWEMKNEHRNISHTSPCGCSCHGWDSEAMEGPIAITSIDGE